MLYWRIWLAACLTVLGIGVASSAPPTAWQQAASLGRGVNVLGYDPIWDDFASGRFKAYHFTRIRQAGFSTVRVVLFGFRHMDGENRLAPDWLKTLDWVVDGATRAGLNVILDEHDFDTCSTDPADCRPKLLAFWHQVAARYHDRGDNVLFEPLNEPHGRLDAAHWNSFAAELLAVIRATNPTRAVVIGPTGWNSLHQLDTLTLPAGDRHIIVTYHYYEPMRFTHQGAGWVPEYSHLSGVTCCTPAERTQIDHDFDDVAAWSKAHDRPVLLGEFGAYGHGDMASRVDWTATVARSAERHGFSWLYWQFDSDFVVWDMTRDDWVEPILKALVPQGR